LQVKAPPPLITSLRPNPMTAAAMPQTLTISRARISRPASRCWPAIRAAR
jgi:hypothetical protein